jgi:hypothetical protein
MGLEVILMLKKLLTAACLAMALGACATTPPTDAAKSKDAVAQNKAAGCVGSTATRLPVQSGECAGFGSVYTKDDIDRTGAMFVGDALRLLDPTVTVR